MLLFELFPTFVLIVGMLVGLWLVALDRQARERRTVEQTTQLPLRRPRS